MHGDGGALKAPRSHRGAEKLLCSRQKREQRFSGGGKKRKTAVIFVIASFASTERKVVWNVLGNLNSPDSEGVVALIFLYRQKTPIL